MIKKYMLTLLTAYTTLSAAPQAVVFDFGGVLTTEPNREIVVQFLRSSFNLSPEEFEKINQQKKKALQAGKTDEEFWLEYAEKKNMKLPKSWVQDFKGVLKQCIGINEGMFALVNRLKQKGLPVALLSNVDPRLAGFIREFGLYAPFDPCLLSCEIGLEKPDARIYEYLLKEMKLPAQDIVFIDDRPENVDAAKRLGLDAILFVSQEHLQKELEVRFKELHFKN